MTDAPAGTSLALQNSAIHSSRDTNVNQVFHQHQHSATLKDAMDILIMHAAVGALFDSEERFDPPKCHPETRTAVLGSIDRWARKLDGSLNPIVWLRGAAGAGKSAISQSSAESWKELGILAATFFFSRTAPGRNESSRFVATLAYEISLSIPSTRPFIEGAVRRDAGLFKRSMKSLFSELIMGPLAAASVQPSSSYVVVIDGLDECCLDLKDRDAEVQQREILETIAFYAGQKDCPLRFLLASRPERQIRTSFGHDSLSTLTRTIILNDSLNPDADIRLFLDCRFSEIRHDNPYLGPRWPPDGTIDRLIEKSSGHFIYAATAVKYLERPRQDPREALEAIMNSQRGGASDSPFADLDALYILILKSVTPKSLPVVTDIFRVMCFADISSVNLFDTCKPVSPTYLERAFFLPAGSVQLHLVDLHSILEIPSEEKAEEVPIRFIHASFSEFLLNQRRSAAFHIKTELAHSRLQIVWLKHLFIQSLHDDFGHKLGYNPHGAVLALRFELKNKTLPPSSELSDGLVALVSENQEVYERYIRQTGLSRYGVKRNDKMIVQEITSLDGMSRDIRNYLKSCKVRDFKFAEGIVVPEEDPRQMDASRSRVTRDKEKSQSAENDVSVGAVFICILCCPCVMISLCFPKCCSGDEA